MCDSPPGSRTGRPFVEAPEGADDADLELPCSGRSILALALDALGVSPHARHPRAIATVRRLWLNGALSLPGEWGSTASGASHTSDTYFSGTGRLTVLEGVVGTVVLLR